ncbi:RNA polymerase sigma factor [Streptomyces sp. NPDC000410]|uniref:RNA polymerase sigma factor n=1 Tax=Streptomyces sp. NPDC000410 TaxID=3154254 RepID=UPI003329712E
MTDLWEGAENSDAAVVVRSLQHPELFAELYNRYAANVHRYCRRRLGDGVADDVTAETFLTAFRTRRRFDTDRASALPWLCGIAADLIDRQRRTEVGHLQALVHTGHDPVAASWAAGAGDRPAGQALRDSLAAALARLSSGDRNVLLLAVWEGFGHEDIGEALGIPVEAARSRLDRARREVRAALGDTDPTLVTKALKDFRADAPRPDRARLAPGRQRLLDLAAARGPRGMFRRS